VGEGRTRRLVAKFTDGTGTIDLVWFKGLNYVTDKYKTGTDYIVFGKPTEFGHIYNIPHPDIDPMDQADQVAAGLTPFYNTSEKMKKSFLNSRAIQNLQYTLLSSLNWILPETLPVDVLSRIRMMPLKEAIRNVHFPESTEKLRQAQLRLKFDELFFIQLNILRTASLRKLKLKGIVFPTVGNYFNTFYKDYLKTREKIFSLREYIDKNKCPYVLTHIDAVPDNFLFDLENGQEKLYLIDWEYAGMQDPHVDIAMFCIYAMYDRKRIDQTIDFYFGEKADRNVRIKIYCYIAICGLLWSNWCEYKRTLGVEFGEYSLRQYRYAKEYYEIVMSERKGE
jgi:thiamine kinase-like enzyme